MKTVLNLVPFYLKTVGIGYKQGMKQTWVLKKKKWCLRTILKWP